MFGRRWRLFRLCGIPVSLDASWLIILALLTFSIASLFPALMHDYFGGAAPALPTSAYWLTGSSRLLVVERGCLAGMVSLIGLLRFLSLKIELEDGDPGAAELDGEFRLPDQPSRQAVSEQHLHHAGNGRGYA